MKAVLPDQVLRYPPPLGAHSDNDHNKVLLPNSKRSSFADLYTLIDDEYELIL
jgi:hypothetical protein